MAAVNANALSSDISRRNPQDEYELIQRIGSGTYGDVYKVGISLDLTFSINVHVKAPIIVFLFYRLNVSP